jgi:hypothetical protein
MPTYTISPEDILFFRDGRPMETAGGHGARWPEPSVIFDALHAALHRAFPEVEHSTDGQPTWEHEHRFGRSSDRDMARARSQRFGSLATAGPFPVLGGTGHQPVAAGNLPAAHCWLFPRPQDVTSKDGVAPTLLPMKEPGGQSDLPAPLRYPLGSTTEPSKEEPLPWWTKEAIEACLRGGRVPSAPWAFGDDALFAREWHTGIAIDPATQTTGHGEAAGRIYAAQYLRLRDGVTLGIHATMPMKNGQPDKREERITKLFPANRALIVGGQQRLCRVEELKQAGQSLSLDKLLPVSAAITSTRVRWLLLSPAVFPAITGDDGQISAHPGGWLPNWVAPSDGFRVLQGDKVVEVEKGRVLLKSEIPRNGESREARRERVRKADFLDCRLVAACVPKPIVLTGWTERVHLLKHEKSEAGEEIKHGPRPTLLAVPAGAVYYFEGEDAPRLAEALAWHGGPSEIQSPKSEIRFNRRSTLMGEKGFGLGVCGTWDFYRSASTP